MVFEIIKLTYLLTYLLIPLFQGLDMSYCYLTASQLQLDQQALPPTEKLQNQ